jgi:hypothetical protein
VKPSSVNVQAGGDCDISLEVYPMAVVRAKTSASYGLIIFLIFLIVVAITFAVVFYSNNAKLEQETALARKTIGELGTPGDVTEFKSPTRFGAKELYPGKTPLRAAMTDVDKLRSSIAGNASASGTPASVLTDPDGGLITLKVAAAGFPKEQSLFDTIDQLLNQRSQNETRAKTAEANLASAQAAATGERTNYETDRTAWRQATQKLEEEKAQLTAQAQQAEKDHKDDVTKYESQIDTAQRDLADAARKNAVALKQKDDEITRISAEMARYKAQLAQFKPKNPADLSNERDGNVIRVEQNSDVVYINLGNAEHVSRGLTFAIYDPKYNISVGAEGPGHEKASLEVIDIGEHESTARVTHVEPGQAVNVGDVIANPVYHADRARKFHFFVYGDFDLDGDGTSTPGERQQLIRLIQNWGGVIDDQLTTQTDFLVVGALPGSSTRVFDPGSEEDKALEQKRNNEQKVYGDLVAKARDYSIPVLNSNRFLAMIGYYNTTVVHPALFRAPK